MHLFGHVGGAERCCVTPPKTGEEVDVDHHALACAQRPALIVTPNVGIRPGDEAFGFCRLGCLDPLGWIYRKDLLRDRPGEHPPHGGEKVPGCGGVLSATPKSVQDVLLLDGGGSFVAVGLQNMNHQAVALLVRARLHLAPIRRFCLVFFP
ncbi:hypothetical protein [Bradyrhizobium sp. SZCCHNRI1009]|uniref:hypothetical protein n=1 Tax=Bradyrhizobium sp. SZCCHNRI1009 TaxID=3057277 RepID=UPI002916C563|nr:hypothetical protein [Bradyrhizobium sp. SZCCHNRI1009]